MSAPRGNAVLPRCGKGDEWRGMKLPAGIGTQRVPDCIPTQRARHYTQVFNLLNFKEYEKYAQQHHLFKIKYLQRRM
jgi:hypothetical protein